MKILTNKKYNELILKPLQGCFAQVDDDMLLRENGLLYAENKKLHSIIKEVREYIEKASYLQCNKILEEKELLEILDKENK